MRKYLVTRFVAGLLFAAAAIMLILGIVAASALGLSGGWGPGSRAWLVVPVVIITFFNTTTLLVFGAVLFFLTRIEMNFETIRGKGKPGRPRPRVVVPPPAPTLDRGPSTPIEESAPVAMAVAGMATAGTEPPAGAEPPAAAAEAPVAEEAVPDMASGAPPASEEPSPAETSPAAEEPETVAQLPGVEVIDTGTSETPEGPDVGDNGSSVKLPGADEAARIAREMSAARPNPPASEGDPAPTDPAGPPEKPAD